MKKVIFISGGWSNGGIENLISIYISCLSNPDLHMDVFTFYKHQSKYTRIVEDAGGRIFAPNHRVTGNHLIKNIRAIIELVKAVKGYDIIHYNTAFGLAYLHCAILKIFYPKLKIILHSHGDNLNPPYVRVKFFFHQICKHIFCWIPDLCLACSDESGKWLFTKKVFNSRKYHLIKNATFLERYIYNEETRFKYREKYKISTELVIGTIGRIEYQKNPFFILDIISQLKFHRLDFKFIWVGNGLEYENIKKQVFTDGLSDFIIFVESTDDVSGYLSAMDVFILPSIYEGVGIVLLEAQANGLYCIASDTIPNVAQITNKFSFLPINPSDSVLWAENLMKFKSNQVLNRNYPYREIKLAGYETQDILSKLTDIYACL